MYARMYRRLISMLVLLILLVPQESNASRIEVIRKLAEGDHPTVTPVQSSPSPSPAPSINSDSGGAGVNNSRKGGSEDGEVPANSPKPEPIVTVVNETCEMVPDTQCRDQKDMTACLPHSTTGPQGSFLLVQNGGESSLEVKVTFVPGKYIYEGINIQRHQTNKINISAHVGGSSSIVLNAGNGNCVIHIEAPGGNFFEQFPSYAPYVTPINGAYLLFGTALIIGGMWACCKLGKSGQQIDGVPYQELEMGQPESLSSMNVETAEGWDQGWDDEWDEEKAVKSPGGNHVGNGLTNGHTSRSSNTDGWGNDWDD